MKMIFRHLLCLGALVFAVNAQAQVCEEPQAIVADSGSYESLFTGQRVAAPGTARGFSDVIVASHLIDASDQVQAQLKRSFGFRYFLYCKGVGPSLIPVEIRVTHPPITNPQTSQISNQNALRDVAWANQDRRNLQTTFTFNEPWELVPGLWHVQVFYRDLLLIEKSYSVVVR